MDEFNFFDGYYYERKPEGMGVHNHINHEHIERKYVERAQVLEVQAECILDLVHLHYFVFTTLEYKFDAILTSGCVFGLGLHSFDVALKTTVETGHHTLLRHKLLSTGRGLVVHTARQWKFLLRITNATKHC